MNWDALSAIGSFGGAIAVTATVVYLAIQIRRNTLSLQSQTHYLATSALAEAAAFIGAELGRARVYRIGMSNPESLTEDEWMQFALLGISQFRRYENLYFQYKAGLISDDFWHGHSENILWFHRRPGMQIWWKEKRLSFSRSFRDFLEGSQSVELGSTGKSKSVAKLFGGSLRF